MTKLCEYAEGLLPTRKLLCFMNSNWFIPVPFLLALLANVFAIEIPIYVIIVILAVFVALFNRDTKPIVPMFVAMYFGTARENSAILNDSGIYQRKSTLLIVLALGAIALLAFIVRVIANREYRRYTPRNMAFFWGYLLLGVALVCGGFFSSEMSFRNILFGLLEFFALSFCYFFFINTIDWKHVKKDYIFFVMLAMGLLLTAELANIYLTVPDVILEGKIIKTQIVTGWGIQNNIGGMLILSLPFVFWLATFKKHGWIYILLAVLIYFASIMTLCRTALLLGGLIMAVGVLICIVYTKGRHSKIVSASVSIAVVLSFYVFWRANYDTIRVAMSLFFESGFESNGRIEMIRIGWKTFLRHPLFGFGYYPSIPELNIYDMAIPGRYHNIIVQFLASTGLIGFLAYAFHFAQICVLAFKKRATYTIFTFGGILALVGISFVDNHFFNFGPGILYAVMLCFMEGNARIIPESPSDLSQGTAHVDS